MNIELYRLESNIAEMDRFDIVSGTLSALYSLVDMLNAFYKNDYPALRITIQRFESDEADMILAMRNMADVVEFLISLRDGLMGNGTAGTE